MIFNLLPHLLVSSAEDGVALFIASVLCAAVVAGVIGTSYAGAIRARRLAFFALVMEFSAAFALVELGFVFSRFWYLVLLILVAGAIVGVAATFRPGKHGSDWIGSVSAFLAIPLTILGAVQFVLPGVAEAPTGTSYCADVPVQGSRLVVRTGASGNYLRTGPGSGYEPVSRLDAGCLVGADGYCLGQATPDAQVGLPDIRWYRMRFTNLYFAAGPTVALGVDTDLDAQATSGCPRSGLSDALTKVEAGRDPDDPAMVLFQATGRASSLVGIATVYPANTNRPADAPGIAPKLISSDGSAYLRVDFAAYKADVGSSGELVVAIVPCLGPISPSPSRPRLFTVDVKTGTTTRGAPAGFNTSPSEVKFAACAISPSAGNEDLAKAASSKKPAKAFNPEVN